MTGRRHSIPHGAETDSTSTRLRRWIRRLLGWTLRPASVSERTVRLDNPAPLRRIELPAVTKVYAVASAPEGAAIERLPLKFSIRIDGARWFNADPPQRQGKPSNLFALRPLLINPRVYGPLILPHPLYQFQSDGVDFLLKTQPGALLADDMGLGKTVQTIVALRLLFHRGDAERALIVAPRSVITSWQRHFSEWSPELTVAPLVGDRRQRHDMWRAFKSGQLQVGITTYDMLWRDVGRIPPLDVLVADEVQKIKNLMAKRTQVMWAAESKRRWALSGTPLENSVGEFAAILHFLDPSVHDVEQVKRSASRMMLRRRKEQILNDLPELVSHIEYIALTSAQRRAYKRAERAGIAELRGKPRRITNVLALIHTLKQICNGAEGQSAKLGWLQDYLDSAADLGDKVLVFSQYTNTLPIELRDHIPLHYHGSMTGQRRE